MPKIVQHPEILVQARRGGTVESLHRACAALAGPDGEIVERWGDPGMVTYWRSSAKPLQAQAWLADGTIEHFGWGAEELAIMSASHDGLDFQADLVRRMLADLGLGEQDLRCDATLKARHNCSGNHTGFLAACVHHGWDVPTLPAAGPSRAAGRPRGLRRAHGRGRGGTLRPASTAAASSATRRPSRSPPPPSRCSPSCCRRSAPRCARTRSSWRRRGQIDTEVMRALPGATSKCGAEGLSCFSLPDGRGLAVKVVDGADRAHEPAGLAALEAVVGADAMSDELRRHRPAADHERRRRRGRRTARRRPGVAPAARRAAGSVSRCRRPRPGPYVRRGGAPGAPPRRVQRLSTAEAAPRSALFGLRLAPEERSGRWRPPRRRDHDDDDPRRLLEPLLLSDVVSAALGATL